VDVAELLAEIVSAGAIRQYEHGGKSFGAVRNFGKFQRPKKPNDIHPANPEILDYCCTATEPKEDEPKPVRNQFGTGGEKEKQMEDGGGRVVPFTDVNGPEALDPDKVMFDAGVSLIRSAGKSEAAARSWLAKARKDHGTESVIAAISAAKREGAIEPVSYMEASLRARDRTKAAQPVIGI